MPFNNSIQKISQVLDGFSPAAGDLENMLPGLAEKYPFFIPVRYIQSRGTQNGEVTEKQFGELAPYAGNWILLYDFLERKLKDSDIKADAVPEMKDGALHAIDAEIAEEITVESVDEAKVVGKDAEAVAITVPTLQPTVSVDIDSGTAEPQLQNEIPHKSDFLPPLFTQDYFLHEGEKISDDIPSDFFGTEAESDDSSEKSLMVMMSFTEWLAHFKNVSEKQLEEDKAQRALKTMWQREKLAAAMEVDDEEIPERVLEMAVNSISMESGLASETLADLYIRQGKIDHAVEMYRKLSLGNPQKNAYFAHKIEEALKEKQS